MTRDLQGHHTNQEVWAQLLCLCYTISSCVGFLSMYLVCLRYVNIILAATVDSQSKQFWNFCRKIEGGGGKSGFPKIEGGGQQHV